MKAWRVDTPSPSVLKEPSYLQWGGRTLVTQIEPTASILQIYQRCSKLPTVRISTVKLPMPISLPPSRMMHIETKFHYLSVAGFGLSCTTVMSALFESQKANKQYEKSEQLHFVLVFRVCLTRENDIYITSYERESSVLLLPMKFLSPYRTADSAPYKDIGIFKKCLRPFLCRVRWISKQWAYSVHFLKPVSEFKTIFYISTTTRN